MNTDGKRSKPVLKALRERLNLSQSELARAVNASEKTVRNWENDGAIPTFDKAVILANVLEVSLKELALAFELDAQSLYEDDATGDRS